MREVMYPDSGAARMVVVMMVGAVGQTGATGPSLTTATASTSTARDAEHQAWLRWPGPRFAGAAGFLSEKKGRRPRRVAAPRTDPRSPMPSRIRLTLAAPHGPPFGGGPLRCSAVWHSARKTGYYANWGRGMSQCTGGQAGCYPDHNIGKVSPRRAGRNAAAGSVLGAP